VSEPMREFWMFEGDPDADPSQYAELLDELEAG
jgi:hypothetical protein